MIFTNVYESNAELIEEPARRSIDIKRRLFGGIKASTRGLSFGEFLSITHCEVFGLSSWPFTGSTSSIVPSASVGGSIMATASFGSSKLAQGG